MKKYFWSFLTLVFLCCSPIILATDLTGDDILTKMDEVFTAESRDYEIHMTIVNQDGQERERSLEILTKDDHALVKFLAPADVEGTALLMTEDNGKSNMWLYLPALASTRKVASHLKNGSFMGTDFTYQDFNLFGSQKYAEDYQSTLLGSENFSDTTCYLLKTIPTDPDCDYSQILMWVRQNDYVVLKLEFYDAQEKLLKVMTNLEIKTIDTYLTPTKITMHNVQKNTKTILQLKKVEYDTKIPDYLFTTRYLEKG